MSRHLHHVVRSRLPRRAAAMLAASLAAAAVVGQDSVRFVEKFNLDDVIVREAFYPPKQTKITSVRMLGASHAARPGFPVLPFVTRKVALPAGAKIADLIVDAGQIVYKEDQPIVQWQQGYQAGREVQPPDFPPDEDKTPLFYPAEDHAIPPDPSLEQYPVWPPAHARIREVKTVAGYDVLAVDGFPVAWRPGEGVLQLASSVTVAGSASGGTAPPSSTTTVAPVALKRA